MHSVAPDSVALLGLPELRPGVRLWSIDGGAAGEVLTGGLSFKQGTAAFKAAGRPVTLTFAFDAVDVADGGSDDGHGGGAPPSSSFCRGARESAWMAQAAAAAGRSPTSSRCGSRCSSGGGAPRPRWAVRRCPAREGPGADPRPALAVVYYTQ